MGFADSSRLAEAAPAYNYDQAVAFIAMRQSDKLRMYNLQPHTIDSLRAEIASAWPKGIQRERQVQPGVYQFKLCGYPWMGQGDDAVYSRRLTAALFRCMLVHHYGLISPVDISKHPHDKDMWVFIKRGGNAWVPADPRDVFTISFNMSDLLRVIDAPPDVPNLVGDVIMRHWPAGIQDRRSYCGVPEFKLRGNPWYTSYDYTSACILTTHLLARLWQAGYRLYASVDISASHGENTSELDTWVLVRNPPQIVA